MGKTKKHGKPSKGTVKRNPKNDTRKRKVKYVDPTSSVSRDVRDSLAAIAQEIERGTVENVEREAPAKVSEAQANTSPKKKTRKSEKRRNEIAVKEGIHVKKGMTLKQAYKMANNKNEPRPMQNIPAPDYEDEEDDNSQDNHTDQDYSDTANERTAEYRKGGYHPVVVGDMYHDRYRIVKKLGWGYFSTVWLCWDYKEERYQAMKIQKSAKHYSEAAYDEIKLLSEIMQADPHRSRHCARLNDYFEHSGPNGTHVCMVFDVYGENLLSLMERYEYRGIPLPIVKCISRQILVALEHIAGIQIIHTDLKPENVLLSTPKHAIISLMRRYHPPPQHQRPRLTERDPKTMTKSQRRRYYKKLAKEREVAVHGHAPPGSDSDDDGSSGAEERNRNNEGDHRSASEASKTDSDWEVERFHHVILADFGNSCWTYKQFTDEVQTRQYRCPEVILGEAYSTPIDMWSCACMIFELITGEFLFDPKKGDDYSRDEDHLALMSELLGELPESMRLGEGKYRSQYYNSRGELRSIKDLHFWNLEDVLHQRYRFTRSKAKEIADFLLPMLEYLPEKRATPTQILRDFDAFFEIKEDDYEPLCFNEEREGADEEGGKERVNGKKGARSSSSSSYDEDEEEEDDEEEEEEENDDDDDDEDEEEEPLDDEDADADSYSSSSREGGGDAKAAVKDAPLNRSRRATGDDERAEVFRYWEEHPILNRLSLEARGLTITDIQAVLSGRTLDNRATQEAANEVIMLLSEETERLSTDLASDGHDADQEDEGEMDDDSADTDFFRSDVVHAVDPKASATNAEEKEVEEGDDEDDEDNDEGEGKDSRSGE